MSDAWLKVQLDKMESKLDRVDERINSIDVTLAKQAIEIETHIKRTDIAEQNIALLRDEAKPLHKHVDSIQTILKSIGIVSLVVSVVSGIIKIVDSL